MSKYNQPPKGLFGRYCIIPYGMSKEPFIYRIVNSGVRSNTWIEPPMTYQSENNPVLHDHMEDVIYVVCDTLIDEGSKILKVALKDVELIEDRKAEVKMTNGEKIQQDFECEVCEPIIEDNIIHVIFADKSDSAIGFDLDWWNLEYEESTTIAEGEKQDGNKIR